MKYKTGFSKTAIITLLMLLISGVAIAASNSKTKSLEERVNAQQTEIEELKRAVSDLNATKESGGEYGYDHGFFIRTTDKDFELKFRFFAQLFYEYDVNDGAQDASTFGIRRARFIFSGNAFNENLTFMIMPEMVTTYTTTSTLYTDTGGNQVIVRDNSQANWRLIYLWAQMKFADEFQIRVGEFKPPIERFYMSSHVQEFGNFPLIAIAEPFTPNLQLGAMIFGTIKDKFRYEAFAMNGTGLDRLNINKAFITGLRLTYAALGKADYSTADLDYSEKPVFQLSAHGSYDRADGNVPLRGNRGDNVMRAGADVVFKYRGFAIVPEFIFFRNYTQNLNDMAFAIQTGYFIIPHHLEIAGQADWLRYDGPQNDRYELSGGLNYYFYGHPVKLQADYSYLINRQAGNDQNNHRIRLGFQMGFF